MLIKRPDSIKPSDITDERDYLNRREFMQQAGRYVAGAYIGAGLLTSELSQAAVDVSQYQTTAFGADEKLTKFKDASRYNNFYEFSLDKELVSEKAQSLVTDPWTLTIEGEAETTGTFALEDVIPSTALEERIYRFRCVEAWSMVVPWLGVPLASVLKAYKPTSKANYVRFETLFDPKQMPNQDTGVLEWPYQEALRIDEAMHPLTMLVVGMYGKTLPNQNGAPIRLIVPWKYGFKSIKSIVKISFTEQQPATTWSQMSAKEYGFYANVNPAVSHPRWDQTKERRIGSSIFAGKLDTLPFNGYGDEVAALYAGMNLQQHF